MRQHIAKYGLPIVIGLLLLVVLIVYFSMWGGTVRGQPMAFYVDEESGVESVQPASKFPPLIVGGRALVRVVKFSCDGGKTVQVGYYERYTDEAKRLLEEDDPNAPEISMRGLLVRSPEKGSRWVPQLSDLGKEITARARCDDPKQLISVSPPPQ
jgi:hypothetical protein